MVAVVVTGCTPSNQQSTQPSSQSGTASSYSFEFLNGEAEGSLYLVVSSSTDNVPDQLPIAIEFLKNGESVWSSTIDGDPSTVCKDETACGLDGPSFSELNLGPNDTLEVVATNKDGQELHKENAALPQ